MLTRASVHASPMPSILEVGSKKALPIAEELTMTNSEMRGKVRKLLGLRRDVCADGSCWVNALLASMHNYEGTEKFPTEAT
eukprot:1448092-Pleurochrysis_carterae.AAC.1